MAIPRALPGEVIDVRPFGAALAGQQTATLVRSARLQVIRLVLPAGHEIPSHSAPDEMTVQCLEGHVTFTTLGQARDLTAGSFLFLPAGEPHALRALEASSLLVTLVVHPK
jgi:quercetin dioxygenase-like cupin family protein